MNWLDLVIIAVLAWLALAGLSAGILREAVTLLGAVVGVALAGPLYKRLADDLLIFDISERTAHIVAFLAIFAAVWLAGQIAAILLKRVAALLMLGPLDRVGGLFFGLLKGFVVVEVVLILFAAYRIDRMTRAMDGSLLTPFFLDGLPVLLNILPGEFREAVERFPG